MGVWKSSLYWGHIVTLAAFVVTSALPAPPKADKGNKSKKA
jgi:hypothetical protein